MFTREDYNKILKKKLSGSILCPKCRNTYMKVSVLYNGTALHSQYAMKCPNCGYKCTSRDR